MKISRRKAKKATEGGDYKREINNTSHIEHYIDIY